MVFVFVLIDWLKVAILLIYKNTTKMNKETHYQTLSKYVFAEKISLKKGGFCYQLYEIVDSPIIKIGGLDEDGFYLTFYNSKKSCKVATIITLYNAIRGVNSNLIAFKK